MNRRAFISGSVSAGAMAMAQGVKAELIGNWQGTLAAGGANLRLALDISQTSDGLYLGTLTSIDQGGGKIPIETVKLDGHSVRLDVKVIGGVFEGTLDATSSRLSGTWTQGVQPLPLEFTRSAKAPEKATPEKVSPPPTFPLELPLLMEVPIAPTPFPAGGKTHLVYELHITNFSGSPQELLLKRIEVLDGGSSLASFEGTALIAILGRIGGTGDDKRVLDGGRRAIAFLWVTIGVGERIPTELRHRITVGDQTLESSSLTVSQNKPLVLSPPLRGSGWMALNGPGNASQHRRAVIPIHGRPCIAQRFAIDWVKMGDNRRTFEGDAKESRTHFAYGSDVLAVADAVVVAVKDGIPENVPGITSRAVPITLETIGGNHIILDLGGGRFGFYAHLQPGSPRVKVGDRVKRGQVMALVGNTGNSTEPHLHFHVSDGNLPLGSEGLAYVLEAWHNELPLQNDRVTM